MTVPLLTDSKGTKIGKTEGNVIGLTDAPAEFYAKIMSLGDDAIIPCFTLLTDISTEEIEAKMKQGENPMTLKKQLAFELTKMLNDEKLAKKAQEEFESVHQKGESVSVTAPVFETKQTDWNIIDLFIATNQVTSKSEARRLFEQQAIEINNAKCQMLNIKLKDGDIIKIGKRKFVKIHVI